MDSGTVSVRVHLYKGTAAQSRLLPQNLSKRQENLEGPRGARGATIVKKEKGPDYNLCNKIKK